MPQYVYALHDFFPEHEDEVSFRTGEPVEVVEKDDLYGDGWWQGRNISGKVGLFPQSYTASTPPSPEVLAASAPATSLAPGTEVGSPPKTQLQPLREEPESESSLSPTPAAGTISPAIPLNGHDANFEVGQMNGILKNGVNGNAGDGEMMKATMTDVQKAIEQLGRSKHDGDGARSFSFASTGDGDRDTEGDTETDTDFEMDHDDAENGQNWHKGARRKLAEKARRAVEEAEKLERMMNGGTRNVAPPIEVELSDESEGEDDEQHLPGRYDTERQHPYIPEEDEGEEEDGPTSHPKTQPTYSTMKRDQSSAVNTVELPARDDSDLPTATAAQSAFSMSSLQASAIPPQEPAPENQDKPISLPTPITANGHNLTPPPVMKATYSSPLVTQDSGTNAFVNEISAALSPMTSSVVFPQARPQPQELKRNSFGLPRLSGQHQQVLANASPVASVSVAQHDAPVMPVVGNGDAERKDSEKRHPSDWTVEEVVEWLKSKGFAQDVYDKFIEQEITGDVLLELDVNLLKTEIGIMAFGKRMRIANSITDLRRPPSVTYSDQPASPHSPINSNPYSPLTHINSSPNHSRDQSRAQSQSYLYYQGHPQSPQGSAQYSFLGPLNAGSAGLSVVSPESAPHTGDFAGSDRNVRGTDRENGTMWDVSWNAEAQERGIGLGIGNGMLGLLSSDDQGKSRPSQLTLSPSDSALRRTAQAVSGSPEDGDEDRGVMSEGEAPLATTTSNMRRRLFGRRDSSGSRKGKRTSDPSNFKSKDSSPTKDTDKDYDGGSSIMSRRKKSVDSGKTSDRLSLFGNTFGGPKNRKPPPRYSSNVAEALDTQSERSSSLSISRLYGQSGKKPNARFSDLEGSPTNGRDKTKVRPTGKESKSKDTETQVEKDPAVLRKRSSPTIPPSAVPAGIYSVIGGTGMDQLKPGQSILQQVGESDHKGWMRKKGDRYNTWKLRYFILKGPHLYWLASDSMTETKIKGYVNILGYKVVADENANPGRYAFKIIHDHDRTHFFSSDQKVIIREWMKAIMKATIGRDYTKPVISSCNIPTIPLTVAQAMNPSPRPPSPSARDATQKALRRENPNQLSSRDARVLMGLPSPAAELKEHERLRLESFFMTEPEPNNTGGPPALPPLTLSSSSMPAAPPRPPRELRTVSSQGEIALNPTDRTLIEWANSHLPSTLRITNTLGPLCSGLALFRLAESIRGKPSSPPVPDSAFPKGPSDDKLDGLFKLFDFLLDNDVKMGSVSINDIRHEKRDKILQLLKALKAWDDKRLAAQSIGKGVA